MLIKIGRSFVGRTVLIIAALISIMAALLFYCNLYATWAVRERASDSYLSMGKYYTKDLDTKLYAIAEYLAGSSMESDFQTIVYVDAQNRKRQICLGKRKRCIRRCLMIFSCTSRRNTFSSIHQRI